ncbi:MAG TPA: TonB-dependent receptor [Gemmatimonadaceae bacterium]
MRLSSLPLLAASIALPLAARAQDQSADTAALSPVVVTATKVPATLAASTAATTVLNGAELRARGTTTLMDALRGVPGMALGRTSGPGSQTSLFLRGGNSNFTKVLVDGVPLNAPGGAIDLSTFTTDDVDRIEIVRGPASVLYGSDAMTGVIQIFTKRGGPSALALRVADRDAQYDASATAGRELRLGATTRAHGSLNAGYHRGEGFLPFNNQFRDAVASAAAGVVGVGGTADAALSYADARYHYPTNGSGEPVDSNAWTGSTRLSVSANALARISERLSARAQVGHATRLAGASDLPDSPGDNSGYYSRSHARTVRELADVQLAATLPMTVGSVVGATVEAQTARSRGWSEFGGFASTSGYRHSRTNRALYAQLSAGSSPLTVEVGGRRERLRDGDAVNTGRAALAIEPIAGTILRASLATAFKEPAFDELFDAGYSIGEPSLRPERNRSREAGVETRLPGRVVTVGATVFDQRFRDLVQYRYVGPGISNYYNIVAATARGLELEGRLAPVGGLTARASYTLQRTRVTNPGNGSFGSLEAGKALLRRPRRSASVDATWSLSHASLFATVTRTGARDDFDYSAGVRRRLDPYTLVDAAAEVPIVGRPTGRSLALTVRAENLGGARYQNVYGFETPGRVLFVGVRVRD